MNVTKSRCLAEGCARFRLYGIAGGKAQYCSRHKLASMINVKTKLCEQSGCVCVPSFGMLSDIVVRRCFKHITDGMAS